MKSILRLSLFLSLALFAFQDSYAQDVITKKSGKELNVWIQEVSDTQIKYIEVGDPNKIVFTIDRAIVAGIEFSYGKKMKKDDGKYSEEYFLDDRANNIKINFFAIRLNALIFTYEKALSPVSSIETSLKIIGVDFFDNFNNESGIGIDVGYKLKLKSLFRKDGSYRPNALLHGGYIRPMLGFHAINEDFFVGQGALGSREARIINLGIDLGKQWVINEKLSFDIFLGFHYYGGPVRDRFPNGQTDDVRFYSFNGGDLGGSDNTAASFGIRIGYLFGAYGKTVDTTRRRR